jgi:hypothetical protein
MSDERVFPVRRRLLLWFGWFWLILIPVYVAVSLAEGPPYERKILIVAILGLAIGLYSLKCAWNVREIRIDAQRLLFLPVGAELRFADIDGMEVPSWMDRRDTPPRSLGGLRLKMATKERRIVTGAFWCWDKVGSLYLYGCDSDAILEILKDRIPRV